MANQIESPLFIVGASRSGTTLLRLMLNAHPRIAIPHEFKYFAVVNKYAKQGLWKNPLDDRTFEDIVDAFLAKRDHVFEDMGLEHVKSKILEDSDRTIAGPFRVAAREWMSHYGKSVWGEKTPYHLFYADVLIEMFPEARFVYMMRDPRAVVRSMNKIEYFSDDTVLNALNWKRAATVGLTGLKKAVPSDQYMVLKYEDLALDPQHFLEILCDFIGEEFDDQMLSFYKDSSKYMAPEIKTKNVTRAVTDQSIDTWRDELDKPAIRAVEDVCGPGMEAHGYVRSLGSPTFAERINIGLKTRFFDSRIRKNADFPGHTVTYPMFARFRRSS